MVLLVHNALVTYMNLRQSVNIIQEGGGRVIDKSLGDCFVRHPGQDLLLRSQADVSSLERKLSVRHNCNNVGRHNLVTFKFQQRAFLCLSLPQDHLQVTGTDWNLYVAYKLCGNKI